MRDDQQAQRPVRDDHDAWRAQWTALNVPRRTEPEINENRQRWTRISHDRRLAERYPGEGTPATS